MHIKRSFRNKIEDIKIEPISVEFQFNIILLPFEIYFKIKNGRMFWNHNKLIIEKNIFKEGELLEFEYFIQNQKYEGEEFLKLFNNNFSLKSLYNNEVSEQPKITQSKK